MPCVILPYVHPTPFGVHPQLLDILQSSLQQFQSSYAVQTPGCVIRHIDL